MATTTSKPTPIPTAATSAIPPLHNGDRLTREEFHRRYEAMPRSTTAELVEGVVYMPSPVRYEQHGKQHFELIGWLSQYVAYTPGTEGGDNGTLKLDMKNEPQPDAFVIVVPAHGGQVSIDDDGYVVGGPEFVGEVSASSASFDLHDKLEAYRRNRVQEYVVWRVEEQAIDWFVLRGEDFERLSPSDDGFSKSIVFPGLWLDPQALMNGDLRRVFDVVQMGLKTPEHAEFVERLAKSRRDKQ